MEKKFKQVIHKGNLNKVKYYLTKGINPSSNDNRAIRIASDKGYLEIVKLLLEDSRVDPSALDNEAIRYASCGGHTEIVKKLLEDPRVDPSSWDN